MSKPMVIGVLTKYTESSYFASLLKGIYNVVRKYNAQLLVINTFMIYRFNSLQGRDSVYYDLASDHIDGWLVLSEGASNEYIDILCKSGKPVVLVSYKPEDFNCSVVMDSSFYGGYTATRHLIEHGHRRICFVGWPDLYDMGLRFNGYRQALEDNGIPFDPDLVVNTEGPITLSGKMAMQKAIKQGIMFTAVFAANDFLAFGVMDALKEAGYRIPEDVAVIGYDNTIHAKNSNPSLSSMNQNILEIGTKAAETLLGIIMGGTNSTETVLVKSNLVLRNSCGCTPTESEEDEPTKENLISKNAVIKRLEDAAEKNYIMGSELLTTGIDEIKKLIPQIVSNFSWECVAFWKENLSNADELVIHQINNIKSKSVLNPNIIQDIKSFPPKEYLPDFKDFDETDVVWILPVSTIARDWGIIAYVSPFNYVTTLFSYDSNTNLFNLLGIAMDREVANVELKMTLETLQQTQEQLVQSEKLGSLGGLVAGVSHEINTPIGVSVTAASFMQERTQELIKSFETGKLKREELEKYLKLNDETNRILLINLNKASNLIQSFKQIAVDQSIEEKRRFRIKEYIDEVLLSLQPKLKKTNITVHVDCPEEIEAYTYPGGISQIITNMVVNSLIHAFDEGDEGRISISASLDKGMLNFIFTDTGKGIPKSHLNRIFDPFFTTRRGEGGTGLGLNIIYNLITQKYGGSIKCESEIGKGTTFIIKIPFNE